MIDSSSFITLGPKILSLLKGATDHYTEMKSAGIEPNRDLMKMAILTKILDWNPTVKGVAVLDGEAKEAMAGFIAAVAFNLRDGMRDRGAA